MAASNRPKAPVKRAAANGHANGNGNRSYVVLELSSADVVSDERIPLFTIDGTEYTMPAEAPGYIGIEATHLWATESPAAATDWLMSEMLGDEGFTALRTCKTITRAQYQQVVKIVVDHVYGEEDPKAP
jgi:hypothetical protein